MRVITISLRDLTFGILLLCAVVFLGYQAQKKFAAAQTNAPMKLQSDGPTYPNATFQLANGASVLTNNGPNTTLTLGGTLVSLGTQTAPPVAWTGAYPGEIFICGIGSSTASAATMAALEGFGVATSSNQVTLGVRNNGSGLLSATNQVNIGCTPFN